MNPRGNRYSSSGSSIARNVRGATAGSVNNKSRDLIPGINVRNAVAQVMPWNWNKNLDVFDNYSTYDGPGDERVPVANSDGTRPWFGKTDTSYSGPSGAGVSSGGISWENKANNLVSGAGANSGPANINSYSTPNYDAQNRAFYDRELNRFDDYFGQLDRSKSARINNINNNYNDSLNTTNLAWKRAQENHNEATNNRLRTRARQVGVADDDFKKQRDAYDRYFARIGAGSSSAAQHTVPHLLAKAANKIRSDIEENNAGNERTQTIAFNRARDDHERNIGNLGRDRDNQLRQAEMDWETKRGDLFDKKAQLQTQRDLSAGKHYTEAINNANPLIAQATQSANNAIAWGDVNPKFKVDQVEYKPDLQKDWSYENTKTKVVDQGDENEDNAYDRYFRDREEEKKRKGWITPTNV